MSGVTTALPPKVEYHRPKVWARAGACNAICLVGQLDSMVGKLGEGTAIFFMVVNEALATDPDKPADKPARIPIVWRGKTASVVRKLLTEGQWVMVNAQLYSTWEEDENGEPLQVWEIQGQRFHCITSREEASQLMRKEPRRGDNWREEVDIFTMR